MKKSEVNTKSANTPKKFAMVAIAMVMMSAILILTPLSVAAASYNITFGQVKTLTSTECRGAAGGPVELVVNMPTAGNVRIQASHNDFRVSLEPPTGFSIYTAGWAWEMDLTGWTGAMSGTETIYLPQGQTAFYVSSNRFSDPDATINILFTRV